MRNFVLAIGAVVAGLWILVFLLTKAEPPKPRPTAATMDHTDWHIADRQNEVKWIGGQCYARARDGSTVTSRGAAGLVAVGEKYCIFLGAKDTPFGVPDER